MVLDTASGWPYSQCPIDCGSCMPTSRDPLHTLLARGVYRANVYGPNGEHILFSVTHEHRRLSEALVQNNSNLEAAQITLEEELDRVDPIVGVIPLFVDYLIRGR